MNEKTRYASDKNRVRGEIKTRNRGRSQKTRWKDDRYRSGTTSGHESSQSFRKTASVKKNCQNVLLI